MIDLHTHSNKSDGTDNPGDLIKLAKSEGLKAIALTDHDTLEGLEEARISAIEEEIIFIPGIEISTQFPGGELHILGLNISDTDGVLNNAVKDLKERRHQRNKKIVKKMQDSGIDVSYDDILQIAGGDAIGRPHFARFLINRGVISSIQEAFKLYLGDGKKFYEPRELMKDEEAISLIHQAGGKAVIAHPGSLKLNCRELEVKLKELKGMGLDGIEAYYPGVKPRIWRRFSRLADKFDLIITGGSDYHGANKPDRRLGRLGKERKIHDFFLEAFL